MGNSAEVKMVPALCTQCGGKLTVDPSKETADCPFCGASFLVEKAINNYQVQHATFEHVDNVNIDMSGTVHSVLDFVGKQMSEGRELKRELRREEKELAAENQKQFFMNFFKIGLPMLVILFIMLMVMNFFFGDDSREGVTTAEAGEEAGTVSYEVSRGLLYLDIPNPEGYNWEYDMFNSRDVSLEDESNRNGVHFTISPSHSFGTAYAVLHWRDENYADWDGYFVYEVEVEDGVITDVTDVSSVDDMESFIY
ncbi:MAG: hypothetical protein IJT16_03150 [Lachnospiraceae bacterium]|nr:hypothetical protein [Lachnospiraceae bacterium]